MTRYGNTQTYKASDGGTSVHFGPMAVREDGEYVRYDEVLPILNDNALLKAELEAKDEMIRTLAEELNMLNGLLESARSARSDDYDRLVRMKVNENFTSK